MDTEQKRILNLELDLMENGHKCTHLQLRPPMLVWCEKDVCDVKVSPAEIETKRVYDLSSELHTAGHKCVVILESYPPCIRWCEQEICNKTVEDMF